MKNITVRSTLAKTGLAAVGLSTLLGVTLPALAAPGWDNQPRFEQVRAERHEIHTLHGIVTSDLRGNSFTLDRDRDGKIRVFVRGGEPRRLSRGDRVNVTGFYKNGDFHTSYVEIVRNR